MMVDPEIFRFRAGAVIAWVPFAFVALHERQAQVNHGLTLRELARGVGLDASHVLAIVEDRPWMPVDEAAAAVQLTVLVDAWTPAPAILDDTDAWIDAITDLLHIFNAVAAGQPNAVVFCACACMMLRQLERAPTPNPDETAAIKEMLAAAVAQAIGATGLSGRTWTFRDS